LSGSRTRRRPAVAMPPCCACPVTPCPPPPKSPAGNRNPGTRFAFVMPTPAETDVEVAEILGIIDAQMPVALRADYLRMRDGVAVTKDRRERVGGGVGDSGGG
jgi:hypothetical protein